MNLPLFILFTFDELCPKQSQILDRDICPTPSSPVNDFTEFNLSSIRSSNNAGTLLQMLISVLRMQQEMYYVL